MEYLFSYGVWKVNLLVHYFFRYSRPSVPPSLANTRQSHVWRSKEERSWEGKCTLPTQLNISRLLDQRFSRRTMEGMEKETAPMKTNS